MGKAGLLVKAYKHVLFAYADTEAGRDVWIQKIRAAIAAQVALVPMPDLGGAGTAASLATTSIQPYKITFRDAVLLARVARAQLHVTGSERYGQLGCSELQTNSIAPLTQVATLHSTHAPSMISCGRRHTVAITTAGTTFGWGSNEHHQLGLGASANVQHATRPIAIFSLRSIKMLRVCAGADHCLGLTDDGRVLAWGSNCHGQCGQPVERRALPLPEQVAGPGTTHADACEAVIDNIFAGSFSSCIVDVHGSAWTAGDNRFGQLGVGWPGNKPVTLVGDGQVPTSVLSSRVHATSDTSCSLDVAVDKWTLVLPTQDHAVVKAAFGRTFALWLTVPKVELAQMRAMTLEAAKLLFEPIRAADRSIDMPLPREFTPRASFMCAHVRECTVLLSGRCGMSTNAWRTQVLRDVNSGHPSWLVPRPTSTFEMRAVASDVAAGWQHGLIAARGGVFALGLGCLGLTTGHSNVLVRDIPSPSLAQLPTAVASDSTLDAATLDDSMITAAQALGSHLEAAFDTTDTLGEVENWPGALKHTGETGCDQLAEVPTEIKAMPLEGIVSVAAGWRHSAAMSRDGRVYTWGGNALGGLGTDTRQSRPVPLAHEVLPLPARQTAVEIAAGDATTSVITIQGVPDPQSRDRQLAERVAMAWFTLLNQRRAARGQRHRKFSVLQHSALADMELDDFDGPAGPGEEPAVGASASSADVPGTVDSPSAGAAGGRAPPRHGSIFAHAGITRAHVF